MVSRKLKGARAPMYIRNSAKALVVSDDGKVLLNKCCSRLGEYYALPGGGQNPGETLQEAVKRELLEETGVTVKPLRLAAIYERIASGREDGANHKMYFVFHCKPEDLPVKTPTERDSYQIGMEWVPLETIEKCNLFPAIIRTEMKRILAAKETIFLGSERKAR